MVWIPSLIGCEGLIYRVVGFGIDKNVLTKIKISWTKWRKVEQSGELSAFFEGLRNVLPNLLSPNPISPNLISAYRGYYILRMMVCQGSKYRPKKREK
jgi:hypothetical protein